MVIRSIPDIDCGAIQKLCYDPLDKGIKVYILRSKIRKKTFFTDCLFRIDCKKVVTYLVFDMLCIGFLKAAEGFRIRFDKFRKLNISLPPFFFIICQNIDLFCSCGNFFILSETDHERRKK